MKPLRFLAAGLLWVLACLLGLVGGLLCVTVLLLPLGLPLIFLARRLFGLSGRLVVPKAVRHPVAELTDTGASLSRRSRRKASRVASEALPSRKSIRKATKSTRKRARKAGKKLPGRQRRVLGVKV